MGRLSEYDDIEKSAIVGCDHLDFTANVSISKIADSPVWYADLTVKCSQCGQDMQFVGFPMGLSPGEPTTNVSSTELRIPFRPYTEEEAKRRFLSKDNVVGFRVSKTVPKEELQ